MELLDEMTLKRNERIVKANENSEIVHSINYKKIALHVEITTCKAIFGVKDAYDFHSCLTYSDANNKKAY